MLGTVEGSVEGATLDVSEGWLEGEVLRDGPLVSRVEGCEDGSLLGLEEREILGFEDKKLLGAADALVADAPNRSTNCCNLAALAAFSSYSDRAEAARSCLSWRYCSYEQLLYTCNVPLEVISAIC